MEDYYLANRERQAAYRAANRARLAKSGAAHRAGQGMMSTATKIAWCSVFRNPIDMTHFRFASALFCIVAAFAHAKAQVLPFPPDPAQSLERTCFQTARAWVETANLRSDVAILYGIDPGLPVRIETWRNRGYRIHVMTGVSWGNYQDYLYGRFDGINHEDEAQTDRRGNKVSHGGDVYYMCPGTNYGKFLCVGVQRALDAGAEAIHLEEPEFWVKSGYSEGFKREWHAYYGEDWQPPHSGLG